MYHSESLIQFTDTQNAIDAAVQANHLSQSRAQNTHKPRVFFYIERIVVYGISKIK